MESPHPWEGNGRKQNDKLLWCDDSMILPKVMVDISQTDKKLQELDAATEDAAESKHVDSGDDS